MIAAIINRMTPAALARLKVHIRVHGLSGKETDDLVTVLSSITGDTPTISEDDVDAAYREWEGARK